MAPWIIGCHEKANPQGVDLGVRKVFTRCERVRNTAVVGVDDPGGSAALALLDIQRNLQKALKTAVTLFSVCHTRGRILAH